MLNATPSVPTGKAPSFIDLFSGCGGFTLGMLRAGFRCLAAIDFDNQAINTLRNNLCKTKHPDLLPVENALERDLTRFNPTDLAQIIGTDSVDVIVGGPPCQGFSTARQVDGSNHGRRLKEDPRRYLYRSFLKYVDFFKPKLFVIENVLGIRSAAGGIYYTRVMKEARALGYRVHGQVEDAWALGVPQKRRRQLFIGVRLDLPDYFIPTSNPAPRAITHPTLWEAIGDLPPLRAGTGSDPADYDIDRRRKHIRARGDRAHAYLKKVAEIDLAETLTNHVARPHNDRDLRDFARLREGENSATAMRDRGVIFEFPYDKSSFKDRYTRQARWAPCSTIVAHLSKDGLMFIHPTQNRSLTPREAARVQSFPDWFVFPKARTHAFRLIGNAVPPLVGEAIGLEIHAYINASRKRLKPTRGHNGDRRSLSEEMVTTLPGTAVAELKRFAKLDRRQLRELPTEELLHGWHLLLSLFPHLHPENARDHGTEQEEVTPAQMPLPGFDSTFCRQYTRSGWPVALALIGEEAWRRHAASELSAVDLFCGSSPSKRETNRVENVVP